MRKQESGRVILKMMEKICAKSEGSACKWMLRRRRRSVGRSQKRDSKLEKDEGGISKNDKRARIGKDISEMDENNEKSQKKKKRKRKLELEKDGEAIVKMDEKARVGEGNSKDDGENMCKVGGFSVQMDVEKEEKKCRKKSKRDSKLEKDEGGISKNDKRARIGKDISEDYGEKMHKDEGVTEMLQSYGNKVEEKSQEMTKKKESQVLKDGGNTKKDRRANVVKDIPQVVEEKMHRVEEVDDVLQSEIEKENEKRQKKMKKREMEVRKDGGLAKKDERASIESDITRDGGEKTLKVEKISEVLQSNVEHEKGKEKSHKKTKQKGLQVQKDGGGSNKENKMAHAGRDISEDDGKETHKVEEVSELLQTDVEKDVMVEDESKARKKRKKKLGGTSMDGGDKTLFNKEINDSDIMEFSLETEAAKPGNTEGYNEKEKKAVKSRKRDQGADPSVENSIEGNGGKTKKCWSEKDASKGGSRANINENSEDCSFKLNPKRKLKRVSFVDDIEVFGENNEEKGLVRGKQFSKEEDKMVVEAVIKYIEEHNLGEEGLQKVLYSKSHREVRNCWKEIATALPWRPRESIYYRAHILFERDETRTWTPEDIELVKRQHEKYGPNWKQLAEDLGKHRFHVKDLWRRVKFNWKKGHWSQEEYQNLFDLVNMDLRMRAFDKKQSKHGMLRDNICWGAISDKITRSFATCCHKWYDQLSSPMVAEGIWNDTDDYRLLDALYSLDAYCPEDVDWENLLEHRSGDVCRKRWSQMVKHIGEYGNKPFAEQVEVLSRRYCPELIETRETFEQMPFTD